MRALILALSLLLAVPALAQVWGTYTNDRFGYIIAIPPGFHGQGEADNGDGQVFEAERGEMLLRVYGGNNLEVTFAESLRVGMQYAREAGWDLSYERVTRTWASYSGTRNGRILYARAIVLCDSSQFAAYELEYPEDFDRERMDAAIRQLNASLKTTGDCS
jgi:hypothetical protein